MQVRTRLRCIVTTIDSNSCLAVMSQTLPLSFNIFLPFSDFHRAPGNDHFFSANTAVIKWMSNHGTYRWSVHHSLSTSRLTNCTLLGYSINTDCQTTKFMKLGVSNLISQTHYCVIVWVVMNFVKCSSYIIVIESVTVYHQHVVQCSWILVWSCTRCLFSSIIV